MRFCIECGTGLSLARKCPACGFSAHAPRRKGPPFRALSMALLPTVLGVLGWAYHEYELTHAVGSMTHAFDTISAQVQQASSPAP